MLLYHPAFDFHHSVFRILVLMESIGNKSVEPEKLRILDFYLLFPREISFIQVTLLQVPNRKKFESYPQYESISSPAKVFYQLEPVFENSLRTLKAASIVIEDADNQQTKVKLTRNPLPADLKAAVTKHQKQHAEVLRFLTSELYPYPLHGTDGLKARTKLLPSKNDRR